MICQKQMWSLLKVCLALNSRKIIDITFCIMRAMYWLRFIGKE